MYKLAGVIWNDDGTPATFAISGRMSGKTPNIKPTPLEALEELKFQIGGAHLHTHDLQITPYQVKETCLFEVIEDALKRLEQIEDIRITARFDLKQVDKEHKALKIIKEKPQTLYLVATCLDYETYLDISTDFALDEDIYSKEEYELLKEVLL